MEGKEKSEMANEEIFLLCSLFLILHFLHSLSSVGFPSKALAFSLSVTLVTLTLGLTGLTNFSDFKSDNLSRQAAQINHSSYHLLFLPSQNAE
jgi:hypothetical protein